MENVKELLTNALNPQARLMQETRGLVSKWEKTGLLEGLKNDIEKFVQQFASENAVMLKFNKQAEKLLMDEALSSGKTIYTLCSIKFKDYPYGLKLISGSLEGNTLNVTVKMIKDPDKELSGIISDFYKKKE